MQNLDQTRMKRELEKKLADEDRNLFNYKLREDESLEKFNKEREGMQKHI